jgi:hypothetical protein
VVDEVLDRNPGRECRHAAEVIAMPVCRDEVVDLGQPGVRDRRHDPVSVPGRRHSGIAGVDQDRGAGGCDKQCRVAPLDIHDVDVERRFARLGTGERLGDEQGQARHHEDPHRSSPS